MKGGVRSVETKHEWLIWHLNILPRDIRIGIMADDILLK